MERISLKLAELREATEQVVESVITPLAAKVDLECIWPEHSMRALAAANILGLQVPESVGGHGEGLLALSILTETIGGA